MHQLHDAEIAMRLLHHLTRAFGCPDAVYLAGPDRNPPNDADDVAAALKRSGFATVIKRDLDWKGMVDATIEFSRAARVADVALFYYYRRSNRIAESR